MVRFNTLSLHLSHVLTLAVVLITAGCGSSSRYAADYPLTGGKIRFQGSDPVVLELPEGWTLTGVGGPGTAPGQALVMFGGDSLQIAFREITLDAAASAYYRRGRLSELAALGRTVRDSTAVVEESGITEFYYSGRRFAAFEYDGPSGPRRLVVFALTEGFYECEALSLRTLPDRAEYDRLFSVQQSVLRSLE